MPGRADTDLFSGETAAGPVFSIGIIPRQPEKTHKKMRSRHFFFAKWRYSILERNPHNSKTTGKPPFRRYRMTNYLKGKTIRLRCKKDYPGAHTHILIGRVVEENESYIAVQGRSFHFARIVDGMRSQINVGQETVRVVPWGNVELIHWLTERTDWNAEYGFDVKGSLILQDTARTMIAERRDGFN